jgi:toxin FitB
VNGFLLDTNVVSELVKPNPDARVIQWVQSTEESLLYLSVLTIGEIRKGISSLPAGNKRVLLESWLSNHLTLRFTNRILAVDEAVAERWGLIAANASARGAPLPVIDGLLAATALQHNLAFVSRNLSTLQVDGLSTLNPWTLQ